MIAKTGNVKFRDVLTDCGVSTMYGNGYLTQASIRDRTPETLSGNVSMLALRGSITGMNRNKNSMWNANNYTSGQANCAYYMTPGNLECTTAENYLRIGGSRQSSPDQWTECHYHGYTSGATRINLSATQKGFSSGNAKEAPGQITVLAASNGWLNGGIEVIHTIQTYGTFSDRPLNANLSCPANKTFITVILYQLLFGPDHQPPSDGQAPIGQKYYTNFANVRLSG